MLQALGNGGSVRVDFYDAPSIGSLGLGTDKQSAHCLALIVQFEMDRLGQFAKILDGGQLFGNSNSGGIQGAWSEEERF